MHSPFEKYSPAVLTVTNDIVYRLTDHCEAHRAAQATALVLSCQYLLLGHGGAPTARCASNRFYGLSCPVQIWSPLIVKFRNVAQFLISTCPTSTEESMLMC